MISGIEAGDPHAAEHLLPLVYDELRKLAAQKLDLSVSLPGPGAGCEAVLMSVWRTCWQQGRSALDFLSQLLRGVPVPLAMPP